MPFNVALTGGIASGKSTIANIFSTQGIDIIDADIIAREMVRSDSFALKAICERYGKFILTTEGTLYRSRLRTIIFNQPQERIWLNQLLHPLINMRMQQLKTLSTSPYVISVVPLLVENGLQYMVDRIIVVDINQDIQLSRIQERYNISINEAKKILNAQASRKQRLAWANDIIDNNCTLERVIKYVIFLHQSYLHLATVKQE